MAKHTVYKRGGPAGDVSINLTPMIDCTFQLLIFFVLTTQIASQSLPDLQLHKPAESQAIPNEQLKAGRRVIVNVLSGGVEQDQDSSTFGERASHYEILGAPIEVGDVEQLAKYMKYNKDASDSDKFSVEIRADARVYYSDVAPVMVAAARAGITNVSFTALTAADK